MDCGGICFFLLVICIVGAIICDPVFGCGTVRIVCITIIILIILISCIIDCINYNKEEEEDIEEPREEEDIEEPREEGEEEDQHAIEHRK